MISDTEVIYKKNAVYLYKQKKVMIKKILLSSFIALSFISTSCNASEKKDKESARATTPQKTTNLSDSATPSSEGEPILLTKELFLEKVWNFEKNPENWVFEGERPCIIDFYADWCKPCRMVAPIMDELAKEYNGKIDIYKIDTDKQRELSAVFQIRSIPAVLFCPTEGKPQMTQGALPKETFKQVINEFLIPTNK